MVKYHEEYTLRAQVGAKRTLEMLFFLILRNKFLKLYAKVVFCVLSYSHIRMKENWAWKMLS